VLAPHVRAILTQKIVSHRQTHVLFAAVIVRTVKEQIPLLYRHSDCFRHIEVNAVADLGHHALFRFEHITGAQAQRLVETPLEKHVDRRAELHEAGGVRPVVHRTKPSVCRAYIEDAISAPEFHRREEPLPESAPLSTKTLALKKVKITRFFVLFGGVFFDDCIVLHMANQHGLR
jgi:hypothetical protein